MDYHTITLANCGYPAVTTEVEVMAVTRSAAECAALDLDFDELEWTDAAGHVVPWDDVTEEFVVAAHSSKQDMPKK